MKCDVCTDISRIIKNNSKQCLGWGNNLINESEVKKGQIDHLSNRHFFGHAATLQKQG